MSWRRTHRASARLGNLAPAAPTDLRSRAHRAHGPPRAVCWRHFVNCMSVIYWTLSAFDDRRCRMLTVGARPGRWRVDRRAVLACRGAGYEISDACPRRASRPPGFGCDRDPDHTDAERACLRVSRRIGEFVGEEAPPARNCSLGACRPAPGEMNEAEFAIAGSASTARASPAPDTARPERTAVRRRHAREPYASARVLHRYHAFRARIPRPRNGWGGNGLGRDTACTSVIRSDSDPSAYSASNLPETVPRASPTPQ